MILARLLALLILLLDTGVIISQTQPEIVSKTFIDTTGKLFINKSQPVYFFVSTNKAGTDKKLLHSENSPKLVNPMYLGKEGVNTLKSPSAVDTVTHKIIYPEIDIQYQVYADGKAPDVQLVQKTEKSFLFKNKLYISQNNAFELKANDELSGVENIYISVDSSNFDTYKNPISFKTEGKHTLEYFAYDHTGNKSLKRNFTAYADFTPPQSKIKIEGDQFNDIISGKSLLALTATDEESGLQALYYNLDSSNYRLYTGKLSTAYMEPGEHSVSYYAVDKVNNKETTHSYTFYIDKLAPQVIEEVLGKTYQANGREFSAGTSKLKITSFDNKAGVKSIFYSINNSPFVKYEKPIELSGMKGDIFIKSYAIDNVGNYSESAASNSRKNSLAFVDLIAPWVGHSFRGPVFTTGDLVFITQNTQIILQAKDDDSGIQNIEYQIDNSDLANYNMPLKISNEGNHHISVYGYDNTDNLTRQLFTVEVDTLGPEIFTRFSMLPVDTINSSNKQIDAYPNYAILFISATDTRSGLANIHFNLNQNGWLPYVSAINGFKQNSLNKLSIKASDKLGNTSEKSIEFYIR